MDFLGLFRPSKTSTSVPAAAPAPESMAPTSDELRRLLFDAATSDDPQELESVCRDHAQGILEHVSAWMRVPDELRSNPEACEWYRSGMLAITRMCSEKLDQPDLLRQGFEQGGLSPAAQ